MDSDGLVPAGAGAGGAGGMNGGGIGGGTDAPSADVVTFDLGGLADVAFGIAGTSGGMVAILATGGAGGASGVGLLMRPEVAGSESTKLEREATFVPGWIVFTPVSFDGRESWGSGSVLTAASRAARSFLCAVAYISRRRSCIADTRVGGTRHTMMHPSPPTETRYLPSGENLIPVIASEWPVTSAITSPEKKSNIRIFRSSEHVAMNIPVE